MSSDDQRLIQQEIKHLSKSFDEFKDDTNDWHNRTFNVLDEIKAFQINQPQKCGKRFLPLWTWPLITGGILGAFGFAWGYGRNMLDYMIKFHAGG